MKPDLTPAEIRFALEMKNYTYSRVEREYELTHRNASKAASVPIKDAEYAIADVLNVHPMHIWPSRYNEHGERLKPQPAINYRAKPKKSNVNNMAKEWTQEVKNAS